MHQFVQRTPSVVQQAVADVQQSRSTKRKRESYDDTTIKSVTDLCREHGVAAGCREYKRTKGVSVPENTAHGWLQHYQDSVSQGVPNAEAYKITQRRGRPPALTSGEKVLVNQALDGIRSAPNCESIIFLFQRAPTQFLMLLSFLSRHPPHFHHPPHFLFAFLPFD